MTRDGVKSLSPWPPRSKTLLTNIPPSEMREWNLYMEDFIYTGIALWTDPQIINKFQYSLVITDLLQIRDLLSYWTFFQVRSSGIARHYDQVYL